MITLFGYVHFFNFVSFLLYPTEVKRLGCAMLGAFTVTAKILKQGYRYHHRHSELFAKYDVGLKTLLQCFISEPVLYGDLVYKFKEFLENLILVINLKR